MNLSDQEIGKKIKQYRKGKMTQQELALKIGKTESSVRKYEKGLVTIPLDVLEEIASALGITAFDLMGVEYWDKKYPEIADRSKEYKGFIDYLDSLGYLVGDVYIDTQTPIENFKKDEKMELLSEKYIELGFVPAQTHLLELAKNGKILQLGDDEFEELLNFTKDMIAFKLWQKSQEKK